ncbi:OmpA family protein [Undibacterium sp. RuRC25W]|uniref:OmpA family protein n=1 Tax=Undibacterium sp. RuRC25W TaxID=3413047 RepID=UPI003BF41E53
MKKLVTSFICATLALSLAACSTPPAPKANIPVLPIAQLDRGVQIVLPDNVLFESGKAEVNLDASRSYLERIAYLLTTKTNKIVSVEGHTDNLGSTALNQKLSEQRAAAVKKVLTDLKVPDARMTTVGFSFTHPVASNATDEGRKFNRRTEIIILDEKIENITQGEAANTFETAFSRLKSMVDQGILQSPEK